MSIEQRVDRVEEAISVMKTLIVNHDERLEDYFEALNKERQEREQSRKDFEFKMNAVIDAQLKNETDIAKLKESIIELRESTTNLKEASQSQLNRIENLENK